MKRLVALAGLAAVACSGGSEPNPEPPLLETVNSTPTTASFTIESSIAVDGAIVRVGATNDGAPVFVADGRVFEVVTGVAEWRPLYAENDEPTTLGHVGAIAPRLAGGAWIAGSDRLFVVEALYVLSSPLVLDAGAIHAVTEVAGGTLAGLWMATEQGLFQRTNDNLVTWSIPNASGPVTGIAIEDAGSFGFAIAGGKLVTLETSGADVVTDQGVVDVGRVNAVASAQNVVWAAGDRGVVRFAANESPPYRHYTLGGADAVLSIATDPVTGHAWGRTANAIVQFDGMTVRQYAAPMVEGRAADLTVDKLGDVFTAGEATLDKNGTGATGGGISFAADVQPWIQAHCSQCHMNQTQNFEDLEVFRELAEDALSRVRTGDMPRCAGGVRCETSLEPGEYAVLEKWLRDGMIE